MSGQTILLRSRGQREDAKHLMRAAPTDAIVTSKFTLFDNAQREMARIVMDVTPPGAVVNVREKKRSTEQNDKMWAMLSDISRAKPEGRHWIPEVWKQAFMAALGHEVQFCEGIDGGPPFPLGFRSSRLSVREMSDLIAMISEYGDRHGVRWSDPKAYQW